jgi:hypothetical protein
MGSQGVLSILSAVLPAFEFRRVMGRERTSARVSVKQRRTARGRPPSGAAGMGPS